LRKTTLRLLLICGLLVMASGWAHAAANSLTINVSATSVTFTLIPGTALNVGTPSLSITSTYNVSIRQTANITLYAFFSSPTAALKHTQATNTVDIPTSAVQGNPNGTGYVSFTSTSPFSAAATAMKVWNAIVTGSSKDQNRTDTLILNINLSSLPQLPADTYSGTLFLQAQAI
jgi:hypothetical protein